MDASRFYPGFRQGKRSLTWGVDDFIPFGLPLETGRVWYVDGDKSTGGAGATWNDAFGESDFDGNISSLGVAAGDVVMVAGRTMAATDTDPISYTTNLTINVPQVSIIGVSRGRTQGGLPQLKVGATTTQAIIRVRAPGVLIANIGINGSGATGGGIRFDDDGGTTYASFGGSVVGCHFKNCVGTTATNAATGGAIQLSGAPWQMYFGGNRFYKNVGDIVLLDTSNAVPQDVIIEDNIFSGPAASIDCPLYLGGGSGVNGLQIRNCDFPAMPTLGSGSNLRYADLTGCVGTISGCHFSSIVSPTGSEKTFAAAGSGAKIPATVYITDCWGETTTTGETGEIFRT